MTDFDAKYGGVNFKDRVDPTDSNYRIVEMRIPHDGKPYGPFEFHYTEAAQRIRRFAAAYLAGHSDLTTKEAGKIIERSHRVDEQNAKRGLKR